LPANSLPRTGEPRHSRRDLGLLVPLSRIEPERLVWLSPGRLAAGKLTVLDGDPGLGKSTLLCDFAARLTRGEPLPGGQPGEPRGVVILSAEDDLFDTIRPRLDAAGGDPQRIFAFPSLPAELKAGQLFAIPSHVPDLEQVITRLQIALLIIDPLVAYLERRINANNDQHVRRAFVALKELAERTGVAIVAVRHLNKTAGGDPLYRGGGSIGIIGAARCGLLLAADPADPTRRILATSKANLASPPASLAFRLLPVPGSDVARVAWEGESPYTAAELLRPLTNGERPTALDAVRAWLRQELAAGPRPASELLAAAEANGLSLASLRRARQAERVVVRKARGHHGAWIWSLPDADDKDAHRAPSPTS
jgi:putative DNA primase/helicase